MKCTAWGTQQKSCHAYKQARRVTILERWGEISHDPPYPVQAPDAGFIRAERAPREEQGEDDPLDHFMVGPPDLAVEVRSPSERLATVRAKAARWLAAGTSEVWIIDGRREVVHVLRREATPFVLHKDDTLTAPDVLPGFATSVAELFARRR